jgi:hypothetical protein
MRLSVCVPIFANRQRPKWRMEHWRWPRCFGNWPMRVWHVSRKRCMKFNG